MKTYQNKSITWDRRIILKSKEICPECGAKYPYIGSINDGCIHYQRLLEREELEI